MPDFRIRLNTEIDSGNARAELEKLIGEFSKDPLKIKVDTGDATKGISKLKLVELIVQAQVDLKNKLIVH